MLARRNINALSKTKEIGSASTPRYNHNVAAKIMVNCQMNILIIAITNVNQIKVTEQVRGSKEQA